PSGQAIAIWGVKVVYGTNNRTFDITFATQTAPGSYSMQVGPEVLDSTGKVKMNLWSGRFQVAAPPAQPQITSAAPSGPTANSLSKVRVTFNAPVALYSLTPPDALPIWPSGQAIAIWSVKVVSGTNNRTFDIAFATQTAPGTYSLHV